MGALEGKVALVTGGASGIGLATAKAFAEAGAAVVIADIDRGRTESAVAELRQAGAAVDMAVASVAEPQGAKQMVTRAVEAFGALHVVFNNAGIGSTGTILDLDLEEWNRVVAINLTGVFLVSQAAVKAMIDGGWKGSIINMGSIAGLVGGPRMAAYNATKAAVVNLTRNMAIDFAPYGIRVNCLCPGTTLTPLVRSLLEERTRNQMFVEDMLNPERFPLGRFAEPGEIARAAVFLASDAASYVTGIAMPVDGGFTSW